MPWFQFDKTYHTAGVEMGQTANRLVKKIKLRKHSRLDRHINIDIPGEMKANYLFMHHIKVPQSHQQLKKWILF